MSCLLMALRQGLEVLTVHQNGGMIFQHHVTQSLPPWLFLMFGSIFHDSPPLLKVANPLHPLAVDMIFQFSQPSLQGWEKSSCPLPLP